MSGIREKGRLEQCIADCKECFKKDLTDPDKGYAGADNATRCDVDAPSDQGYIHWTVVLIAIIFTIIITVFLICCFMCFRRGYNYLRRRGATSELELESISTAKGSTDGSNSIRETEIRFRSNTMPQAECVLLTASERCSGSVHTTVCQEQRQSRVTATGSSWSSATNASTVPQPESQTLLKQAPEPPHHSPDTIICKLLHEQPGTLRNRQIKHQQLQGHRPSISQVPYNSETTACNPLITRSYQDATSNSRSPSISIDRLSTSSSRGSDVSSNITDVSRPVVDLHESVSSVSVDEEGLFFVSDSTLAHGYNASTGETDEILQDDYNYVCGQPWARYVIRGDRKMEIMVDGISLIQARENILENTQLHTSRFDLTTFQSEIFRHMTGDGTLNPSRAVYFEYHGEMVQKSSTIGGFLDTGTCPLMITSAHHSSVGMNYYCDKRMRPEALIGKCQYIDDERDVALIEVERIPDEQFTNFLSLPCGSSRTPMEFTPQVFQEDLDGRADERIPLLKHSPTVLPGMLAEIVKDEKVQYALIGQMCQSGTCHPGESGSLITSLPGYLGSQGQLLPALGIVTGLKTLIRNDENRHYVTEACIFTPLWPFLQRLAQVRGEDPASYRFCASFPTALAPPTVTRDTGYPSTW